MNLKKNEKTKEKIHSFEGNRINSIANFNRNSKVIQYPGYEKGVNFMVWDKSKILNKSFLDIQESWPWHQRAVDLCRG